MSTEERGGSRELRGRALRFKESKCKSARARCIGHGAWRRFAMFCE